MRSPAGSMGSPAGSTSGDALLRTPQRSFTTLLAVAVLGVCVLAVAGDAHA